MTRRHRNRLDRLNAELALIDDALISTGYGNHRHSDLLRLAAVPGADAMVVAYARNCAERASAEDAARQAEAEKAAAKYRRLFARP